MGGRVALRSQGLADHGRLASVRRLGAVGRGASRPRGPIRHRAADRCGAERRRHAAPLLPVRAPRADPVVGGGSDPPGRGRPHHASDRAGLPRAGEHHGAAHQSRQAHGRAVRSRSSRRRANGDAGAVPHLQRGLLGRRRPRGRGDPTHPAAGVVGERPRGPRAARPDVAAPRAPAQPHPTGRTDRAARRPGPEPVGQRAHRRGNRHRASRARTRPARRVPDASGDRRAPRRCDACRGHRLGPDRGVVRRAAAVRRHSDRPAQPCRRRRRSGGRSRGIGGTRSGRRAHPAARCGRRISPREERRSRTRCPPLCRRSPQRAQPR